MRMKYRLQIFKHGAILQKAKLHPKMSGPTIVRGKENGSRINGGLIIVFHRFFVVYVLIW